MFTSKKAFWEREAHFARKRLLFLALKMIHGILKSRRHLKSLGCYTKLTSSENGKKCNNSFALDYINQNGTAVVENEKCAACYIFIVHCRTCVVQHFFVCMHLAPPCFRDFKKDLNLLRGRFTNGMFLGFNGPSGICLLSTASFVLNVLYNLLFLVRYSISGEYL